MKVGLVGCGVALPHHMLGLRAVKDGQVVALCDLNRQKAAAASERYSVPGVYNDYGEMLRREQLEVVHVMTPPFLCQPRVSRLHANAQRRLDQIYDVDPIEAPTELKSIQASGTITSVVSLLLPPHLGIWCAPQIVLL